MIVLWGDFLLNYLSMYFWVGKGVFLPNIEVALTVKFVGTFVIVAIFFFFNKGMSKCFKATQSTKVFSSFYYKIVCLYVCIKVQHTDTFDNNKANTVTMQ